MLESATVTLSYKEFKSLVDKAEELKEKEELLNDFIQEKEDRKEIKALDDISNLLVEASECKTSKGKQELIIKGIEVYCNTFNIEIEELIQLGGKNNE